MSVRSKSRVDVRLDAERRARLERLAEASGANVSDLFRRWIDDAYERLNDRAFRSRLAALSENPIELPDVDLLNTELDHVHCPGLEVCGRPELH